MDPRQFKQFHQRLNSVEETIHYEIGRRTKKCRLKLRLPQDIYLFQQSTFASSESDV